MWQLYIGLTKKKVPFSILPGHLFSLHGLISRSDGPTQYVPLYKGGVQKRRSFITPLLHDFEHEPKSSQSDHTPSTRK